MLRFRGFAVGLAVGVGVTLAVFAPWRARADERWYKVRGDVNGDGEMNIADAIFILNYIVAMGPAPVSCEPCPEPPPPSPASLPATGQTVCYDRGGAVIDCGSSDYPGQDGFYRIGCPFDDRFVDNGDGTVTDTCTGLMWQKAAPSQTMNWETALKYAENLTLGGHADWRMPNVHELMSLFRFSGSPPHYDAVFQGPPEGPTGRYLTSTSRVDLPYTPYDVTFDRSDLIISSDQKWETDKHVRVVRGPITP